MNQPPLGLAPKWIHDKCRMMKITEAVSRYMDAKMEIPEEWIKEYNELCRNLNK